MNFGQHGSLTRVDCKVDLETPLCKFGCVKCKWWHFTREICSWSCDFCFCYTHSPPAAVQGYGREMTETISKRRKKISLRKHESSFEMTIWSKQTMSKCCQKCSVGYPALKLIIYRDSIWLTFGFISSKTSCRMVTKHCFSTTLSECVVDKTDQSGLSRRLKYITCKRVTSYS